MASTTQVPRRADSDPELTGWVIFAALMLLIMGMIDGLFGLAAILNDKVVTVGGAGVIVWSFTLWGWVHLVLGGVAVLACFGLFASMRWARWAAVGICVVSSFGQLAVITAFPLLSLVVIALDVLIIYQLTINFDRV
jgi:hypothetical protein